MERMGSFLDCEWESICKLLSAPQPEIDSSHLLDYSPPVNQNNYTQSSEIASFGTQFRDEHMQMWNDASLSMDFIVDPQNDGSFAFMFVEDPTKETTFSDEGSANQSSPSNEITLKRKNPVYDAPMLLNDKEEMTNSLPLPKKKARISNPTNKGRKSKKLTKNDSEMTEETIGCDPSEDALSNGSEEISEAMAESDSNKSVTLTSTGKKRASRGEATDPQSLYARRRRMRINERLKILQSLVPNGTKVDISTMLEEAFHYVKFLQHQIRLLSSDDLWMYAPLAYNGVDVGAYKRFSSFQ